MQKTCPVCKREIRVFHIRDVEGGWFLNHNNNDGVKCENSLMSYPRPTKRAVELGDSAVSQALSQPKVNPVVEADSTPAPIR